MASDTLPYTERLRERLRKRVPATYRERAAMVRGMAGKRLRYQDLTAGGPGVPEQADGVKPYLLDLFCGAGGAAQGYQRAGFHVVGVDIAAKSRYIGDEFHQADALDFLATHGGEFDVIHASPPCQGYSVLAKRTGVGDRWPRLIESVRELMEATGRPWVIENVVGAPLRDPLMLCGTMFPGLRVLRHRLFESNVLLLAPGPCRNPHPLCHTVDRRKNHYGMTDEWQDFVQVNGGANCSVAAARDAMGIDWMTKQELNESIPPAYSEHIGGQLLQRLRRR